MSKTIKKLKTPKRVSLKKGNPVAKAFQTGEHGARRTIMVHNNKKYHKRGKVRIEFDDIFYSIND